MVEYYPIKKYQFGNSMNIIIKAKYGEFKYICTIKTKCGICELRYKCKTSDTIEVDIKDFTNDILDVLFPKGIEMKELNKGTWHGWVVE